MNSPQITWAERHGNEVYVFVLGKLVFKRWILRDAGVLFQIAPITTAILKNKRNGENEDGTMA